MPGIVFPAGAGRLALLPVEGGEWLGRVGGGLPGPLAACPPASLLCSALCSAHWLFASVEWIQLGSPVLCAALELGWCWGELGCTLLWARGAHLGSCFMACDATQVTASPLSLTPTLPRVAWEPVPGCGWATACRRGGVGAFVVTGSDRTPGPTQNRNWQSELLWALRKSASVFCLTISSPGALASCSGEAGSGGTGRPEVLEEEKGHRVSWGSPGADPATPALTLSCPPGCSGSRLAVPGYRAGKPRRHIWDL